MFSREYLFQEIFINKRCVGLYLSQPFRWNHELEVNCLFAIDFVLDEYDRTELYQNIKEKKNTFGLITIRAFIEGVAPDNARQVMIDTRMILEVEKIGPSN